MLDKVINFYKSNKYVILWTLGYFVVTWAIMKYMFDFNIFSRLRWWQLAHAHIRGFPGMVFCILILAAVPMYVATTIIIARTKAPLPLFSIKVPEKVRNFLKNAFTQTPMDEPESVTTTTQETQPEIKAEEPAPETPEKDIIPEQVPSEMRIAYARAREHLSRIPVSAFDLGNVTKTHPTTAVATDTTLQQPVETEDIPIPTDFDIDDATEFTDNIPQFTDINFDDDDDTPIEIEDIPSVSDTVEPVVKYMNSKSLPYTVDDDVVITDKFAIVSHIDDDFWVADEENWFAAGKTRKSPIVNVKQIAATHNVQPVLYLAANNIMDIDDLRKQWESDGILIITDLKDLK